MRQYVHCPDCLTVRMEASKIVENGRTLQMVCPRCGALDYIPVWGKRKTAPSRRIDREDDALLRRQSLRGTLRSVPAKRTRRR